MLALALVLVVEVLVVLVVELKVVVRPVVLEDGPKVEPSKSLDIGVKWIP